MVTTSSTIHTPLDRTLGIQSALLVIALCGGACWGCSRSANHVAVHPVQGEIKFRGQSPEGACVWLVPKDAKEGVPNPRATVAKDGSFAVTTYDGNDGAPEGDYVVTVQWYKPVRQDGELVGGPNALPAKYASARTSDLKIRVAAGDNKLPPIQLR